MIERETDVAIVGGGPAGLATAIAAVREDGRLRERIIVLERSTYPRHKPCAGGLTKSGFRALADLGLVPRLPTAAITELHVRTGTRTCELRRADPYFTVFDRTRLDEWLAAEARALGIRILEGQ